MCEIPKDSTVHGRFQSGKIDNLKHRVNIKLCCQLEGLGLEMLQLSLIGYSEQMLRSKVF